MRLWPGALGVVLLLLLLTWLLLRGIDTNAPAYAATLQALDDFALSEASLHRDVLRERAGLLRDYDPLVAAEEAMKDAVARLRSYAQNERLDVGPPNLLAAAAAREEELTERFKSDNALLQNSLSYVGLLSTDAGFGAEHGRLAPATGALAAAILHLTRDTSPDSAAAVEEQIDRFAAQAPASGPEAEAAQALLAHARLLRQLLPVVDDTLKRLFAVPSRQSLDATRTLFASHQTAVETSARRYRLMLYVVSLLLLVALARLGLQLRSRAVALRRRAAFEHVIAQNSTRLINCAPAETGTRLQQVLGELGQAIGADRAYVVLAEDPVRAHVWSAVGTGYPPGWPDRALDLHARLGVSGLNIGRVPDVAALQQRDLKDALTAAGVRSWACVPLVRPGRVQGIMGFDASRPARDTDFPEPVMRLAGDAVANALERESLERDRVRLASRLERAHRMQMIGSLASGIAHNFNNVLSAILGYSEMVEPQLTPGTKPAAHLDEIRRAAERGRDLIDNILTFGRRRDARVYPVEMRALLEEAGSLLRASLRSGIELIVEEAPAGAAVSGELAQLQQVILNLGTNAAQAIDGAGSIRVAVEEKTLAADMSLSHGELAPGRYVCLSVTDTGRGFDETVARHLFEPFFTTRSSGTGLGLATVDEIVRDHGGAMNVESKPGQGSRFEAWLPVAAPDADAGDGTAMLLRGRGETVLLVESERERLLRDEEMLAALGYEPVGFALPSEALLAYRATPDRFDIILISHPLPGPDGADLASVLRELAPQKPILLATSSSAEVSVDAFASAKISEVLPRPLVSTELAAALVRCTSPARSLQS